MSFRYLKTVKELENLLHQHRYVVFDFLADWRGSCKKIAPKSEAFAKGYSRAVFDHVDVDRIVLYSRILRKRKKGEDVLYFSFALEDLYVKLRA